MMTRGRDREKNGRWSGSGIQPDRRSDGGVSTEQGPDRENSIDERSDGM